MKRCLSWFLSFLIVISGLALPPLPVGALAGEEAPANTQLVEYLSLGSSANENSILDEVYNNPAPDATSLPYYNDFSAPIDEFSPQWEVASGVMKGIAAANTGGLTLHNSIVLPENYTITAAFAMTDMTLGSTGRSGGIAFAAINSTTFYHLRLDHTNGGIQSIQLYRWNNGAATKLVGNALTWYDDSSPEPLLTLTVEGSAIKGYVNGELQLEYTAASLPTTSKVGFRVYSAIMKIGSLKIEEGVVPPVVVPSDLIFEENFNSGTAKFPIDSSVWTIIPRGNGSALSGTVPSGGSGLLQIPASDLPTDYSLGMDLTFVNASGASGWSAGPTFAHKDSGNFHHFRFDKGSSATAQLYRWTGGSAARIRQKAQEITTGVSTVHRLWVTNENGTVKCYLDGELMLENPILDSGGSIGMRIYGGTFIFDNITLLSGIHPAELPEDIGGDEIIWTITDDFYSEDGDWSNAPSSAVNYDDSGTRTTSTTGNFVSWSNYMDTTSNYEVYYWNPPSDNSGSITFSLSSVVGNWRKVIDTSALPTGWTRLSTIAAQGGTALTIIQSNTSDTSMYASALKILPTTNAADKQYTPGGSSDEIAVLVNQLGYDTHRVKRATIPNAPDGTDFIVFNANTHQPAFTGQVEGNIGDFSDLKPDVKTDYYIKCQGAESFGFTISKNWIQQTTVVPALDFMEQSRQDAWNLGGNTGYGWRDSHQFSFELNSLVYQYMANPAYYNRLTDDIYNMAQTEYPELRTKAADEPTIVWLIKFAATRYYDWGANKDIKIHMLIKEQLAYFLYVYPHIEQWVDREFYENVRDYTISAWSESTCSGKQWYPVPGTDHNLFTLQTVFGGLKGAQPPAHSISPNLMMYEVLERDGIEGSQAFFDAAYDNTQWIVDNLDISDPRYAKGQRMSEHVVLENLTFFLEEYPSQAPSGLERLINDWAESTISRSDNLWDTRMAASLAAGDSRYYLSNGNPISKDYWTGAAYAADDGQTPIIRNEPGNVAGIQAITFAASRVLSDSATSERLKEIGVAAIDDMFGRNPSSRAYFYSVRSEFEGGDFGWYTYYRGGYGDLAKVVGRIDANPAEGSYPYSPANAQGYTEGWVAYNAAWNMSLAYSAADDVEIDAVSSGNVGDNIDITLKAPLNMNYRAVETGQVWITDLKTGEKTSVAVTETSADSNYFTGTIILPNSFAVKVSYGFGLFETSMDINISGATTVPVSAVSVTPASASLRAGEAIYLSATISPDDADDKRVVWTSSDETIATVSSSGHVKTLRPGTATITARGADGVFGNSTITISEPSLFKILLSASPSTLEPNNRSFISIVGIMEDGQTADLSSAIIAYEPVGATLSTINSFGIVTASPTSETAVFKVTLTLGGKTVDNTLSIEVGYIGASTRYQFEDLPYTTSHSDITAVVTDGDANLSKVMTVKPTAAQFAEGAYVDFTIPVLPKGVYRINFNSKRYSQYGIMTFSMNGTALGDPVDGYAATIRYSALTLGDVTVDHDNTSTLRMTISGKSDASTGYNAAIDYVEFVKIGDSGTVAPTDLSALEGQLNRSQTLLTKSMDNIYPTSEATAFQGAIDNAISYFFNFDSTQNEIDNAVAALILGENYYLVALTTEIKNSLSLYVTSLESLLEKSYTPASWRDFHTAQTTAMIALNNPSLNWESLLSTLEAVKTAYESLSPTLPLTNYTISITSSGGGSATANFSPTPSGSVVTLTAIAAGNHQFKEWVVISGGVTISNRNATTATFIMPSQNVEVQAVFKEKIVPPIDPPTSTYYDISLAVGGGGSAASNVLSAVIGDTITITASPNSGYNFNRWEVIEGKVKISDPSSAYATFIMPAENVGIRVVFQSISTPSVPSGVTVVRGRRTSVGTNKPDVAVLPKSIYSATAPTAEVMKALAQQSAANGSSIVSTASHNSFSLTHSVLEQLKGFSYYHDTIGASGVAVRLSLRNPESSSQTLALYAATENDKITQVNALFEKYFSNNIASIQFEQQADWEQLVNVAAKIDLSNMDKRSLVLYSYNPEYNIYTLLENQDYSVDINNYLHFSTTKSNIIIVSNGVLKKTAA